MNPEDKYPALTAYIRDRSGQGEKMAWSMLRAVRPLRLKVARMARRWEKRGELREFHVA